MSSGPRFGRKPPCRSTIRRRVASLAISCCCVCSSCIPRHITAYASNLSRRSGTHITSSSHSCWECTLTQPTASFETPQNPSLLLLANPSGPTALGTRAGGGNCLEVDSTSSNAYIERFELGERRRSVQSCDTHVIQWRSNSANHP